MQTQSKMRNVYNQITVSDITDPTGSSYLTQQCQTTWHNRVKLLDPWGSRMIPQPGLQIYFWPHVTLTSVFDLSKSSGGCFCPKGRNLMPVEMVKALMTWLNAVQRWKVDGARQKISHRHWTMCQILHRKKTDRSAINESYTWASYTSKMAILTFAYMPVGEEMDSERYMPSTSMSKNSFWIVSLNSSNFCTKHICHPSRTYI